jgi:hypothetical protein
MRRDHYVFGYEAEPADERPTDFGRTTGFGRSGHAALASTAPAPWAMSQHSTFDAPSRAIEQVQALKERRRRPYVIAALMLLAATIIASVVVVVVRP